MQIQEQQPVPEVRRSKSEAGATVILFTMLSAFVILPMVALAVDGSILFWSKSRLSAAVDAAALAAGRFYNAKVSQAQNSGPITTIGQNWFYANFPDGWIGSTNVQVTVTLLPASNGAQLVTVNGQATIPLYFARIIGYPTVDIAASAQSSRRDAFIIFVLDRSGSMNYGTTCQTMKNDAINFVNRFTEQFDTMGLITFSSSAGPAPDFTPSQTFKAGMASTINSLSCTGATSTAQALALAYTEIKQYGLPGGLNVVVLMTDGQPDSIVAKFPIKTWQDTRYDSNAYATQVPTPPSTCKSTPGNILVGGLYDYSGGSASLTYTLGLFDTQTQVPLNTSAGWITYPGCAMTTKGTWYARADIGYIPDTDYNGNATHAGYGSAPPYYGPFGTVDLINVQGVDHVRPDTGATGVSAAAINAADYQANVIRSDTTYKPFFYTVGLGGSPGMPIDDIFLERLANDPHSQIYNINQRTGLYSKAPGPAQLDTAFQKVASQILRLQQ